MNILKKFDNAHLFKGIDLIAGVDEAGRGPLAGPVVAAAVIFDKDTYIEGIDDSKKLSPLHRERLAEIIKKKAVSYAYGIIDQSVIDDINILQATLKAMKTSICAMNVRPDLILIDGNRSYVSDIRIKTIIKGDSKSFSIAAASILAKVKRDKIMINAAEKYPNYGWKKNKGYGTLEHIQAIRKYGFTDLHRKSFLRKILEGQEQENFF